MRSKTIGSIWAVGRTCAAVVAASMLLAACATSPTPAYVELQSSIKSTIAKDDQRPVKSVACMPHVDDVSYDQGYVHLSCLVRFTDGTPYTTAATIEARSYQVGGWNFQFDDPGPLDITTAPLPKPSIHTSAAAASSLFLAKNLRPVVHELQSRFGSKPLILSMAIYPGELEAVIGANGEAQLVTAHAAGPLTVGPETTFDGERTGITISQLNPAVPERLSVKISVNGGVPIGNIDRFVLAFRGEDADWEIYPTTPGTRFQAHIMGDSLEQISAGHTQRL